MHYLAISFNHKIINIEDREKLCFKNDKEKIEFLQRILKINPVLEAIIISTCNRVEIYAYVKDFSSIHLILEEVAKKTKIEFLSLAKKAQIFQNKEALKHIFRLASGLESLVIGDAQIIAQIKNDFRLAKQISKLDNLKKVMQQAFKTYAKVKNQTCIFKNSLSISSIAVLKAKEEVKDLKDKEVLVVGAGIMAKIACQYLLRQNAKITLINRTLAKTKSLAQSLSQDIKVKEFSFLKNIINDFELTFFATSSKEILLKQEDLKDCVYKKYIFDLSLPRNVAIKSDCQNKIYYIDDLKQIAKENENSRKQSIKQADKIVEEMVKEFLQNSNSFVLSPSIKLLRQRANNFANLEFQKALKKGYIKNSDKEEAYRLIKQVLNSFLHIPTIRLKELNTSVQAEIFIDKINYIFDLDKEKD